MMKSGWKYIKETPTWLWLSLFLIMAIFTTHALRHNSLEMIKRRDALYAADKSGQGVEQALNNLRLYVYSHMNTNLTSGNNNIYPPIQLKYTYDRLVKAEQSRVNKANEEIFRQAQAYCEAHQPGKFRQVCFTNYVKQHNVKAKNLPPVALYQFDFASPTWSWDAAGWGIILTVGLGAAFITSYIADRVSIRHHRLNRSARTKE